MKAMHTTRNKAIAAAVTPRTAQLTARNISHPGGEVWGERARRTRQASPRGAAGLPVLSNCSIRTAARHGSTRPRPGEAAHDRADGRADGAEQRPGRGARRHAADGPQARARALVLRLVVLRHVTSSPVWSTRTRSSAKRVPRRPAGAGVLVRHE